METTIRKVTILVIDVTYETKHAFKVRPIWLNISQSEFKVWVKVNHFKSMIRRVTTVKYTGKVFQYTKSINFMVKCLKTIAKCLLLLLLLFHGTLYYCVRYSNINYEMRSSKLFIKSIPQKVMARGVHCTEHVRVYVSARKAY